MLTRAFETQVKKQNVQVFFILNYAFNILKDSKVILLI